MRWEEKGVDQNRRKNKKLRERKREEKNEKRKKIMTLGYNSRIYIVSGLVKKIYVINPESYSYYKVVFELINRFPIMEKLLKLP